MDKQSKQILNFLIAEGGCKKVVNFQEELDNLANSFNADSENFRATVRFLHDAGYLEYMYYSNSRKAHGFYLSHKGLYWKKFRKQEILKYLCDKWIDFFAMLLSFCALAVSIIALVHNICPKQ